MKTRFLCPVCSQPLNRELADHLSWSFHLRVGFGVLAICMVAYLFSGLDLAFKLVFLYLPVWAGAEFIQAAKTRKLAQCTVCDFDPLLYSKDWKAARSRVEQKLSGLSLERSTLIREHTAKMVQNRNASSLLAQSPSDQRVAPTPNPDKNS